jgi:hypothetical protein
MRRRRGAAGCHGGDGVATRPGLTGAGLSSKETGGQWRPLSLSPAHRTARRSRRPDGRRGGGAGCGGAAPGVQPREKGGEAAPHPAAAATTTPFLPLLLAPIPRRLQQQLRLRLGAVKGALGDGGHGGDEALRPPRGPAPSVPRGRRLELRGRGRVAARSEPAGVGSAAAAALEGRPAARIHVRRLGGRVCKGACARACTIVCARACAPAATAGRRNVDPPDQRTSTCQRASTAARACIKSGRRGPHLGPPVATQPLLGYSAAAAIVLHWQLHFYSCSVERPALTSTCRSRHSP